MIEQELCYVRGRDPCYVRGGVLGLPRLHPNFSDNSVCNTTEDLPMKSNKSDAWASVMWFAGSRVQAQ